VITPGSVKVCSLRRPRQAEWVVEAKADLFGLIFVESAWRRINPADARQIVDEAICLRGTHPLRSVGVFVGSSVDEINSIADEVGLDLVQVNDRDLPAEVELLERPVIVVIRPEQGANPGSVSDHVQRLYARSERVEAVLIDAPSATGNGGLGETGDWNLAREVALRATVGLAGGLNPENVAAAIAQVAPHLVDAASGLETDREKDPVKIREFVERARSAFAEASIRQMDFTPVG
jgi:phosphoribosylanthranilate isomerase